MIRKIQARNYRCLRYIDQSIRNFQILVGPNASGKTTFLDVVAFLGDMLSDGLEEALRKRSADFRDLLFGQQGNGFELAVEWAIPEKKRRLLPKNEYDTVRYEISIGQADAENDIHISLRLRESSPPGQGYEFRTDGSNLPWVVYHLRQNSPELFRQWVEHVATALPDLSDIFTIEEPDRRYRFLKLQYNTGLSIPSWMASDGTLRMLALTLPAYLTNFNGVYLIEEPENGVHPQAMETVYQSLSSVYSAQILVATHSPVILGCAQLEDILCFQKTDKGETDIIQGRQHPALQDWQGEIALSVLYASGVLG
jgi:predicted ATPase